MTESALELAERALGDISGETQVTVMRERSLVSRFSRSRPTQATRVEDTTVAMLRVQDGHTGSAETNDLSDEGLHDVAARADAGARAAARAAGARGEYPGLPEPEPVRAHDGYDAATAALDPGEAGAALRAAFEACAARGLEAFGIWTVGAVETAIASSAGVRASDAVTDALMKVIARSERGRTGWAADAAVASSALDPAAIAARAVAKVAEGEPVAVSPGEYPVVLEPGAVQDVLDFLGALAFNGLAHAEGRGALVGRLGTRVAAPAINLSDSTRFGRTLPRAFDMEGVPKRPIPLIQDGVAHRVVHDTRSAARAGGDARSTGHATAPGGSSFGPHPTNLVLIGGGAADERELAAPIERGLYVTRFWYVNPVHPKQTLLTGMTRDGTFLIEDGAVTRPVRDVRFTDSALRILEATEALSSAPHLVPSGDFYGRRFATGVVCPALRASGFRITGQTV
ncbi:MAG TPA: metallopeptidase TldD-related protein [Solirubrobacteraceae bacterium]|nr:metallopeptidase TldD-related protein [Solirubrobacteraceae bacterium]